MLFSRKSGRCHWVVFLWLYTLGVLSVQAGGEGGSVTDFARAFLLKYPQFRAEGTMTTTLAGKPPYRCRIAIVFNRPESVLFSYNTDAVKNIIPYDLLYKDKEVRETVYNRDRTTIQKTDLLGSPTRTLFNFVWDVLGEAEHGAGFRSLIFNGLMSMERKDSVKGSKITLSQRIPAGPVSTVVFTFDGDKRLRTVEIKQGDGTSHRIEIRRFRGEPVKNEPPSSR